jgi:hypothetical protein
MTRPPTTFANTTSCAIVHDIHGALAPLELPEDRLRSTIEDLAFGISTIIDGSRVMELDGEPVLPRLGFARAEDNAELLVTQGGSFMHEYAIGMACAVVDGDLDPV